MRHFITLALLCCVFFVAVSANVFNLRHIYETKLLPKLLSEGKVLDPQVAANWAPVDSLSDVVEEYMTQKLDHFSAVNTQTFQQRWFYNTKYWKPNGPVFMYIGGESEENGRSVSDQSHAAWLGKQFGGLLVALEHRYYGMSVPTPDLTTENLQWLSSQQALADLVAFREYVINKFEIPTTTKFVAMGCSYPGCLSAWFALKYPHLVNASIAGSAPVQAKADFYEYDQHVAVAVGTTCAAALRSATLQVVQQLSLPEPAPSNVKAKFRCQHLADNNDPVSFLYVIADMAAFAIQYGIKEQLCENRLNHGGDLVEQYSSFAQWLLDYIGEEAITFDLLAATYTQPDRTKMLRQWMYQSCTEFGFFQTAPAQNSMRAPNITLEWHYTVCERLFGLPLIPDTETINDVYGSTSIRTRRTVFINGDDDPWRRLSILANTSVPLGVNAINIANHAHCSNFKQGDNSTEVVAARAAEAFLVGCYLNKTAYCNASNCGGQCNDDCTCHSVPFKGHLNDGQVIAIACLAVVLGIAVGAVGFGMLQRTCMRKKGYADIPN